MTDNEIIKACKNCLHYEACKGTYYSAKGDEDILHDFDGEMYANSGCEDFEDKDLINRQKAEIERLTGARNADPMDFCGVLCRYAEELINKAKAEAVKEFAERLKEYVESYDVTTGYKIIIVNAVEEETIDNLVKEMVGDDK